MVIKDKSARLVFSCNNFKDKHMAILICIVPFNFKVPSMQRESPLKRRSRHKQMGPNRLWRSRVTCVKYIEK